MIEARMTPEEMELIFREITPKDREVIGAVLSRLKAAPGRPCTSEDWLRRRHIFANLENLSNGNLPR